MSSDITNQSNPERGTSELMEDLAKMLQAEVHSTHLPLVQLICNVCKDPTLEQFDLYSKYTRLAAVVGEDWITVKEELRNATRFGAPAFYCSISAMLVIFTCRRSRSHDDLVSSLTELYNHISAGNEILNKQVERAITTTAQAEASITNIIERADHVKTAIDKHVEQVNKAEASITNVIERADHAKTVMDKHVEQVNKTEASITNVIERADHAKTAMDKHVEQVNKAEASITNVIERADHAKTAIDKHVEQVNKAEVGIDNVIKQADKAVNMIGKQIKQTNIAETTTPQTSSINEFKQGNRDVAVIPGTSFRCKYGTLTIDDHCQCEFNGSSLEAKSLALWLTLPVPHADRIKLMNLNHEDLIDMTDDNVQRINRYKNNFNAVDKRTFLQSLFNEVKYEAHQWSYIG